VPEALLFPTLDAIARLDFVLPRFCRVAWVSDKAREAWQPVLRDIARARPRIFAHAVRAGLYPGASIRLPADELSAVREFVNGLGIAVTVLGEDAEHCDCVIGESRPTEDSLTAIPPCCRKFREAVRSEGFTDMALPTALNTSGATIVDRTISLPEGVLNQMLAVIGLSPLWHEPCSMCCPSSRQLASEWLATGRANGYEREIAAVEEILSWPVEWSALHGIAEIKIPILKVSTNTDATGERYSVRIASRSYPPQGPTGLNFPYTRPRRASSADRLIGQQLPATPAKSPAAGPSRARTLPQRPRSSQILDQTFARVRSLLSGPPPAIKDIFLGNYFNIIQLDDLSVGAAANYGRFKSEEAVAISLAELEERRRSDPLLLSYLFASSEPDLLQLSLKTCLVSALSQKLLLKPSGFRVHNEFDPALLAGFGSAVVIGFGGYMDYIILHTRTQRVHVSDLDYRRRAKWMDGRLQHYRGMFPDKTITISDGSDTRARLAETELASITGSAFCSGTMEELLEESQNCKSVIIQGQSGSVYPEVLFERGVTTVSTTIKPHNLVEVAKSDPQKLRSLLEGRLRPIFYLSPMS
jgi:Putative heavy-metal chelation